MYLDLEQMCTIARIRFVLVFVADKQLFVPIYSATKNENFIAKLLIALDVLKSKE